MAKSWRVVGAVGLLTGFVAFGPACSHDAVSGDRVELGNGASAALPVGWVSATERGAIVARDGSGSEAGRIDFNAVPRKDYGVERTAVTVVTDVQAQANAMPASKVGTPSVASLGMHVAARLDWTYLADGERRVRRHWAVQAADAIVHVSCVDADPALCDAAAASVEVSR